MKKKFVWIAAAALSAAMLAGCGSNEDTTAETESAAVAETETETAAEEKTYSEDAYLEGINAEDYVTLGEYKGIEVAVAPAEVTDEQVDSYIEQLRSSNPNRVEIKDRAVEEGDIANIDYVGKKDGEEFDGGSAEGYDLTIGSGSFIDGFEDGIIGMKTGETKDLNLTFPEEYQNADLAGQDVVFTVTLNGIYQEELPELNDEFVQSLEIEECSTVEELRQYCYDGLMEQAQSARDYNIETEVLNQMRENSEFQEVPQSMQERYYDRLESNLTMQASMYGMDLETLMLYMYGMSEDQYVEEMQTSAEQAAQQMIALKAIADKEGITVTEDEEKAELETYAANYGYESGDAYKEALGEGDGIKSFREYLLTEKVIDFLVENAVVTDAVEEETAAEETTAVEETATEETIEAETAAETQTADETETETQSAQETESETAAE